MKHFPDQGSGSTFNYCLVAVIPGLYLIFTLIYSASQAPWGHQVDPESAYAMNGLVGALGYPFMKNDHPGTTTILLVAVLARGWSFFTGSRDVVEFGPARLGLHRPPRDAKLDRRDDVSARRAGLRCPDRGDAA